MASNRRIYFALQSIGFAPNGTYNFIPAHGVQSAAINTNFNLEVILELGQLSVYENIELIPDIEFTAEKCLDGFPLLCHLATQGSTAATLAARSNQRTTIALNIFGDTQQSASGLSIAEVDLSGAYWASTSFSFMTDGAFKETFSAVGNNKQWRDIAGGAAMNFSGFFVGGDQPYALTTGSGGIQRREDLVFYPVGGTGVGGVANIAHEMDTGLDSNGQLNAFLTILPPDIPGISTSGTNDRGGDGNFGAHVQSIDVSANLGRDAIFELGRKAAFFRYVNFPVQITCDIEILTTKWDNVSALEAGLYTSGPNMGNNLTNRSIRIRTREGTFINLGTSNKLQSVTYGGGDTGGGNVTSRFSYVTYDDFYVAHPADPSNLPYPY